MSMQQSKPEMTPKEFGKLIKAKRIEKQMTQDQLAAKVHVTKGLISQWENGRIHKPQADNLMALARALDLEGLPIIEQLARYFGAASVKHDPAEITPSRLALLRMYGRLPPDVRRPIRALIETLSAALDKNYQEFERSLEKTSKQIRERDQARSKKGKKEENHPG